MKGQRKQYTHWHIGEFLKILGVCTVQKAYWSYIFSIIVQVSSKLLFYLCASEQALLGHLSDISTAGSPISVRFWSLHLFFSYPPPPCGPSYLLCRSCPVCPQLFFMTYFSICRWVFRVSIGRGEFKVFLYCYLDPAFHLLIVIGIVIDKCTFNSK